MFFMKGFFAIPGALSGAQQQRLLQAALRDYPQPPARSNHTRLHGPLPGLWEAAQQGLRLAQDDGSCCACSRTGQGSGWQSMRADGAAAGHRRGSSDTRACTSTAACSCQGIWTEEGKGPPAQQLLQKLRWVTLGPQFDWTARTYGGVDSPHTPLPAELRQLAQCISSACADLDPHAASVGAGACRSCSDRPACGHAAPCSAEEAGRTCSEGVTGAAGQPVEQHWPRDERGERRSFMCHAAAGKRQPGSKAVQGNRTWLW